MRHPRDPRDRMLLAAARLRQRAIDAGANPGRRWVLTPAGRVWAGHGGRPVAANVTPATGEYIRTVDPTVAMHLATLVETIAALRAPDPAVVRRTLELADAVMRDLVPIISTGGTQ